MLMMKSSPAAARNKHVILDVLKSRIQELRGDDTDKKVKILEIASGTGEHAALFTENIANVLYQPTDPDLEVQESLAVRRLVANEKNAYTGSIMNDPVVLDVTDSDIHSKLSSDFSLGNVDAIVCINMIHISPWQCTESLFKVAGSYLQPQGFLLTYGPYSIGGEMVESNRLFDASLRSRNTEWGVRDIESLSSSALLNGLRLTDRISMPANNFSLIFKKRDLH